MEWYKHSTGSHDDPDISDAMDMFGDAGYSVFFIILEIYGQEFNHLDSEGWLTFSRTFIKRKLRKSSEKVEQILNFYSERKRIAIKTSESKISIHCPKYIEIASNWIKRKNAQTTEPLQSHSVVTTAIEEEEEEEVEVEVERKKERKKERTRKQMLTDNEYFDYLKQNSAYKGLDIEREAQKCQAWCISVKRVFSRRTLINWLNRAEKPIVLEAQADKRKVYAKMKDGRIIDPTTGKEVELLDKKPDVENMKIVNSLVGDLSEVLKMKGGDKV